MTTADVVVLSGSMEVIRPLGRRGLRLEYVGDAQFRPAKYSRHVVRYSRSPAGWESEWDAWFATRRWPAGTVLLPSNDDSAWWLASRATAGKLAGLRAGTPGFEAIRPLLVKYRLFELCQSLGIPAPRTWLVEDGTPLPAKLPYPVMVKAQTRIGIRGWFRGHLARNPAELAGALAAYRSRVRFHDAVIEEDAVVALPMVQEYVRRPGNEIYQLAGYLAQDGDSVVAAHRKLLQYPRRFGTGLCFETAAVDPAAAANVLRLLRHVGFHGVFECEFVERDGELLLIDMNPRPYNGMSLEVAAGYELPWFLYLETTNQMARLKSELARARTLTRRPLVWRDASRFWLMLGGQLVSGGFSLREVAHWLRWDLRNRSRMVDPHFDLHDPVPGLAQIGYQLASPVIDPRGFLGTFVLRGLNR